MKISCVCPTHGRFDLLRASLAFFLSQTWLDSELLILNDAPVPIECDHPRVKVMNETGFDTLGDKYVRLAAETSGDMIAHWEDDDVYCPWHLSELARNANAAPDMYGFHPKLTWCMIWENGLWKLGGRSGRRCEGGLAYRVGRWPGYDKAHAAHSVRAIETLENEDKYLRYECCPTESYVFCRKNPGIRQGSGLDRSKRGKAVFDESNTNFGNGEPLTPRHDNRLCLFAFQSLAKLKGTELDRLTRRMGCSALWMPTGPGTGSGCPAQETGGPS